MSVLYNDDEMDQYTARDTGVLQLTMSLKIMAEYHYGP